MTIHDRNLAIRNAAWCGRTYVSLADEHGISPARARVIAIEHHFAFCRVFKPSVSHKRAAEIAAIPDEAIDTSDIPEATEADFRRMKRKEPKT